MSLKNTTNLGLKSHKYMKLAKILETQARNGYISPLLTYRSMWWSLDTWKVKKRVKSREKSSSQLIGMVEFRIIWPKNRNSPFITSRRATTLDTVLQCCRDDFCILTLERCGAMCISPNIMLLWTALQHCPCLAGVVQ